MQKQQNYDLFWDSLETAELSKRDDDSKFVFVMKIQLL